MEVGIHEETKPLVLLENCRDFCGLSCGMVGTFYSTDHKPATTLKGQ